MIPKVIHYVWMGGNELPQVTKDYIKAIKKHNPDYAIKEWNESNFDIESIQYCKQAYEAKKIAFVADYVRFYALYKEGGIYFDTDYEVLKPLDNLLKYPAFIGFESDTAVECGFIGAEKGNIAIKSILDTYDDKQFILSNGTMNLVAIPPVFANRLKEKFGLKLDGKEQDISNVMHVFPQDYFAPINYATGKLTITDNTIGIHHYASSWKNEDQKQTTKLVWKYKEKFGKFWKLFFVLRHPIRSINLKRKP